MRSAHAGTFRFYSRDLTRTTRGRFYFVNHDAPFLPYPHFFGSAYWRVGDEEPYPTLGEDAKARKSWSNGRLGFNAPPAVPLGVATEFTDGLAVPSAGFSEIESVGGIPLECWTQQQEAFISTGEICALDSCCLQLAMARCLELTYDDVAATLMNFFATWIGPLCTTHVFPTVGNIPAMTIVVHPRITIIVCAGTVSGQQLATQAFTAGGPPTPFGLFGTLPLWEFASTTIADRMATVGAADAGPILLVGHSYGAAAVTILAARLKSGQPDRDVCLMTFGNPKPGDSALHVALNSVQQIHIVNDGDIVTILPPDVVAINPFIGMLPDFVVKGWIAWRPAFPQWHIHPDGTGEYGPPNELTADVLLPILKFWLQGQVVQSYSSHFIITYINRLKLQCGLPCWPMTSRLWTILGLFGEEAAATVRLSGDGIERTGLVDAGTATIVVTATGTAAGGFVDAGAATIFLRGDGTESTGETDAGAATIFLRGEGTESTGESDAAGSEIFLVGSGVESTGELDLGGPEIVVSLVGAESIGQSDTGTAEIVIDAGG